MAFSYSIEPETNIIHTRGQGRITLVDLNTHMNAVAADPLFRPGMNTVADLRNAQIVMSLQDAPDLIRLFIHQTEIRKRAKWAVIISRHPEVHLIRFFTTFLEHLPFNMSVFDNGKDAIQWLRGADKNRALHN